MCHISEEFKRQGAELRHFLDLSSNVAICRASNDRARYNPVLGPVATGD
jgi:hypothetical protein